MKIALIVNMPGEHGYSIVAVEGEDADAFLAQHPGAEAIRQPLLSPEQFTAFRAGRPDWADTQA